MSSESYLALIDLRDSEMPVDVDNMKTLQQFKEENQLQPQE